MMSTTPVTKTSSPVDATPSSPLRESPLRESLPAESPVVDSSRVRSSPSSVRSIESLPEADASAPASRPSSPRKPARGESSLGDAPSRVAASSFSRRDFLTAAGALIVSFAWPSPIAQSSAQSWAGGAAAGGVAPADQLDSWLAIDSDGLVTLFSGKVELGTGVQTALAQIVAEELDVPMARMRVIQADTARTPDQGGTVGSKTIQQGGVPIRRAAAEARHALLQLASARLSAPVADLTVTDGIVHARSDRDRVGDRDRDRTGDRAGGRANGVSYAELIGGRRFERRIEGAASTRSANAGETGVRVDATAGASAATPKPPDRYHLVGQSAPRMELPAKVFGTHEYLHNVRVPGMVHGRVVRPSAVGATLASIDESSVASIPGFLKIVRLGNFVGVVAEREEQAIAAARQLKVTWTPPATALPEFDKLESVMRATPATERVLDEKGDAPSTFGAAAAAARREATYSMPFQSHASTGPSCAVADVKADSVTVWSGTQAAFVLRQGIADLLAIPVARVRVIWTEASGCYGHNGADDAAADAALLSREVGRPVRLQWMRQDEHAWDPKGPSMLMDLRGAVDTSSGKIAAWNYVVTTPTHVTRGSQPSTMLAGQLMGEKLKLGAGGGDRNARHNYVVPNNRVAVRWMQESVLRPSALRGLGAPANVFAVESFVDELALAARVDPVEFRLRHLDDPRAIAVIKRVAELARWQPRRSAATAGTAGAAAAVAAGGAKTKTTTGTAKGRGIAFLQYENANAYVASVVDVDVNRATGVVRVTRVFVAHDCGLIINPDGVRNQIEGGTLQTISRTLKEEVRWDREKVTTVDWQSYPILTFSEAPDTIEIALIDHPELPPVGAGEPAVCAVPAAIGNAIADATGIRLRAIPFTPARLKAALA